MVESLVVVASLNNNKAIVIRVLISYRSLKLHYLLIRSLYALNALPDLFASLSTLLLFKHCHVRLLYFNFILYKLGFHLSSNIKVIDDFSNFNFLILFLVQFSLNCHLDLFFIRGEV